MIFKRYICVDTRLCHWAQRKSLLVFLSLFLFPVLNLLFQLRVLLQHVLCQGLSAERVIRRGQDVSLNVFPLAPGKLRSSTGSIVNVPVLRHLLPLGSLTGCSISSPMMAQLNSSGNSSHSSSCFILSITILLALSPRLLNLSIVTPVIS